MTIRILVLALAAAVAAFAQSTPAPRFNAADVHAVSPSSPREMVGAFPESDRYELRGASMLEMVARAWDMPNDKIAGGPNWVATDHFDLIASFPLKSDKNAINTMLQTLLAERFKLKVHNDTRPVPAYAITVAKGGAKLKKSDGTGDASCQSPATDNGAKAGDGPSYATYICHNMTLAAFAEWLPGTAPGYLQGFGMVDQTGLKGAWDFTIKWSARNQLTGSDAIPLFDGLEKQLGLKVDQTKIAMPVIVIDSVDEKPVEASAEEKKMLAGPTEFELAVIKPSAPDSPPQNQNPFLPGGRFEVRHISLRELIQVAWELSDDSRLVGGPASLDKDFFDIVAKAPSNGATSNLSLASIEVMIQSLLKERFGLQAHNEERAGDEWAISAVKPKLTKADPANRSECKSVASTANPLRNRMLVCTNTTMAQLAVALPNLAGGYFNGKLAFDATGIEGAWDFTLNFSGINIYQRQTASQAGDAGAASAPTDAISVGDALKQQLGLRMDIQKHPTTVLVIDHINEKPNDN